MIGAVPAHEPDRPDDETRAFRVLPPPAAVPPRQPPRPRPTPADTETRTWTVDAGPTKRLVVGTTDDDRGARRSPWPRRLRVVGSVLGVLAVIGVAVVVGVRSYDPPEKDEDGGVATDTPNAKHPPPRDVTLETCTITRAGAEVSGTVRNPTDGPADYVISVDLVDPAGIRITGNEIAVDGVAPESRTEWSGLLPAMASTAQSATCTVVKVDRYKAQ